MKAAVYYEPHDPLRIEEIDIDEPREGEVLVRTRASGVCGSDVHIADGFLAEFRGGLSIGLGAHRGERQPRRAARVRRRLPGALAGAVLRARRDRAVKRT